MIRNPEHIQHVKETIWSWKKRWSTSTYRTRGAQHTKCNLYAYPRHIAIALADSKYLDMCLAADDEMEGLRNVSVDLGGSGRTVGLSKRRIEEDHEINFEIHDL